MEVLIWQELSPYQVVDDLLKHKGISLHHETIYQLIYADKANGGNKYECLSIVSKPYCKHNGSYDKRGKI